MWKTTIVEDYEKIREKTQCLDGILDEKSDTFTFPRMINLLKCYDWMDQEVNEFKKKYPENYNSMDSLLEEYQKKVMMKREDAFGTSIKKIEYKIKEVREGRYTINETLEYLSYLDSMYSLLQFPKYCFEALDLVKNKLERITTVESVQ